MSAKIIDGKALAQEIRADLKAEVKTLVNQGNRPPLLAVVLVGDDPASHIYVKKKKKCMSPSWHSEPYPHAEKQHDAIAATSFN